MPFGGLKLFRKCLNAVTRVSEWVSTTVLTLIIIAKPYISHGTHVLMTASCLAVSSIACLTEALHSKYKNSRILEKTCKVSRKLEQFLAVNVMFFNAMKGLTRDVLSINEYVALAISLSASIPLAMLRAYDSKEKFWTKDAVHSAMQQPQHRRVNWEVVKGTIAYAGEVSGTVSLALWTANTLSNWRNIYWNFGISSVFFMVGLPVGFIIKKEESLSQRREIDAGCALNHVTETHEDRKGLVSVSRTQGHVHPILVINARRFAQFMEFLKTGTVNFMGPMFLYASLGDTNDVNDGYGYGCVAFGATAAANSVWEVEPDSADRVEEIDEEASAGTRAAAAGAVLYPEAPVLAALPQKSVPVLVDGDQATRPNGHSPNGSPVLSETGTLCGSAAALVASGGALTSPGDSLLRVSPGSSPPADGASVASDSPPRDDSPPLIMAPEESSLSVANTGQSGVARQLRYDGEKYALFGALGTRNPSAAREPQQGYFTCCCQWFASLFGRSTSTNHNSDVLAKPLLSSAEQSAAASAGV